MFWYHGPKYYTTSDWLGPGNGFGNVMKGDHDVLKPHEGRPRRFGTMLQNIILPQIGLAQEMDLETLPRETTGDHGRPRETTGDHAKTIGFIVVFMLLEQKCEFHWGRTVKKLEIIKKHWFYKQKWWETTIRATNLAPRHALTGLEEIWRTLTDKLFREIRRARVRGGQMPRRQNVIKR